MQVPVYEKLRFTQKKSSDFYQTVKSRVFDHLHAHGSRGKGDWRMLGKGLFFVGLYVGAYVAILLGDFSRGMMLFWGILMALSAVCIVFNIVHDASHHAIFSNRKYNKWLVLLGDLVGINTYIWDIRHNVQHHTFTNILGGDIIIEQVPLIRLSPHQPKYRFHRYQSLYAVLMYSLYTLYWIFVIDFRLFFKKNICNLHNIQHPRTEWMKLWFFKTFFLTYILFIPMMVLDLPWYEVLLGFMLMHLSAGLLLSFVAVLGHFVEGPSFPAPDSSGAIDKTWGDHELEATIDFANRSRFMHWLTGGLNTHIAHHLFPQVCHVHYYEMTPIIQQTAREFGMPYRAERFGAALSSHFRYLRKMGQ
ncbi:MAG: acyl-CoA desaturase [Bacteroidota bacterium]